VLWRSLSGDFWRFDGVKQKVPAIDVDATVNSGQLWILIMRRYGDWAGREQWEWVRRFE
jgi:hypothetical protein